MYYVDIECCVYSYVYSLGCSENNKKTFTWPTACNWSIYCALYIYSLIIITSWSMNMFVWSNAASSVERVRLSGACDDGKRMRVKCGLDFEFCRVWKSHVRIRIFIFAFEIGLRLIPFFQSINSYSFFQSVFILFFRINQFLCDRPESFINNHFGWYFSWQKSFQLELQMLKIVFTYIHTKRKNNFASPQAISN